MAAEKNFENRLKKFLEDEGCWFVKFFANVCKTCPAKWVPLLLEIVEHTF